MHQFTVRVGKNAFAVRPTVRQQFICPRAPQWIRRQMIRMEATGYTTHFINTVAQTVSLRRSRKGSNGVTTQTDSLRNSSQATERLRGALLAKAISDNT